MVIARNTLGRRSAKRLLFVLPALTALACGGPSQTPPASPQAPTPPAREADEIEPEPAVASEPQAAADDWCESLGSPWVRIEGKLTLQPATRFEFDSDTLSAESEDTLRDACEELAGRAHALEAEVVMTPPSEQAGRNLPRQRSEALASYLLGLTCAPEVHVAVRYYESHDPQETTVNYRLPECD